MITILGAGGFIGTHLAAYLGEQQIPFHAPARDDDLTGQRLGDVIYCIGLTADFRSRPFDTVEAHVCKLKAVLQDCHFDSLVYLSSTRVYGTGHSGEALETQPISVHAADPSDLYNLSKLMGESIGLHSGRNFRVARISNVYGGDWKSDNFLPSIIRDAVDTRHIHFQTALDSAKDYISIRDVVAGLLMIAQHGKGRVYNLASGRNVANQQLADKLAQITGCTLDVSPDAQNMTFPTINIQQMRGEFDFQPAHLLDELETLIRLYT